MKVYISCHHPDPANDLAAKLIAAGHQVVSTWHTDLAPRPAAADATGWQPAADRNLDQIIGADALVVIASPDHVSRAKCVPGGKFVEAGAAIALAKTVVTCGGVENGMLHAAQVRHAADGDGVVSTLANIG